MPGEDDQFQLHDLPEGRALTLCCVEAVEAEPCPGRDRKRFNGRKDPWLGEVMDLLAEEVRLFLFFFGGYKKVKKRTSYEIQL